MPRRPNPHRRELNAWRAMIRRCTEPKHKDWPRYGEAGIKVCPEWLVSFDSFLFAMGPAPTQRHWLGRLDVRGDYVPENCHWTTHSPQQRRRAFCRKVSICGQVMTAAEASRLPGQPTRDAVVRRLASGLPQENPPAAKLYRRSRWLSFNGEMLPLPEWARRTGLSPGALWHRIKRGWPLEKALALGPCNHAPPAGSSSRPTT